jgi:hypothetical protein
MRLLAVGFIAVCLLALQRFEIEHKLSHLKRSLVQDETLCVSCIALKALDGSTPALTPLALVIVAPSCPVHTPLPVPPALQARSPYQSRAPPVSFA